ncbi:MAG TPA: DUF429 domain-containing protein [Anaerolineales bacterium]|jgi:hypothetical protein
MLFDTLLFIGVDPSGGRKPFTYAALDQNGKLAALGGGEMDEMLAFIGGQPGALVAINAAPRPSRGLVRQDDVRQTLPPLHISGRSLDMRLAEHKLRQHGINISMTPARKELCSGWVQTGFELYQRLASLGFKSYPLEEASYQYLETHPHACFCALLGQNPLPRTTLEGRIQRQLSLFEQGLIIHDPMDFFEEITRHKLLKGVLPLEKVYTPEELDAIVAAYTAFVAGRHPDKVLQVGDINEGQITLPVTQLKSRY